MAKEEYERVLEDLRHQEGVTANDIRNFEKSAIIQKSLNVVKERAYMQATIRSSNGGAYSQVKSKVARCLKVQKKVAKAQKKAKNQRIVELNDSQQNLNAQLSVEPYGMRFGDKTADWARRTQFAVQQRTLNVKAKEDELEQLQSNIPSRKFKDFSQTQVYNSGQHI